MIIAAGLSPVWQTIMRFKQLKPGEVNRATEVHHFASGKVLNVAIALTHLGGNCKAISVIGGAPREMIDRELSALGLTRHWIISGSTTRSCVTLLNEATGDVTELVENAGPINSAELEEFAAVFAHDAERAEAIVLTGSLPSGTPLTYYRDLIHSVKCPVILDARGPELLAALEHRPWLVKPNRDELAATLGVSINTETDLHSAMRELATRGAQRVFVSDGAGPAWLLEGTKFHRFLPSPIEEVINPIGSGDCLAAGIALALSRGKSPFECIAYGMAAAVENVGHLLTGRLDPNAVQRRLASMINN